MRILDQKQLPYLFIMLIAAIAFLVSTLFQHLNSLLVLEYSFARHGDITDCTFKNLSRLTKITNTTIRIDSYSDQFLSDGSITWIAPTPPDPDGPPVTKTPDGHEEFFMIKELNPTNIVICSVETTPSSKLIVYCSSDNSFILLPRGLRTFVIDNEFAILGGLALILVAVAMIYLVMLSRPHERNPVRI